MKLVSTSTAVALAAALIIPLTQPSEASARSREDFERTVDFQPGGRFSIENKNGSITIETHDEATVRIEAEKIAKNDDSLKDIEIVVEGSGDNVSVETLHRKTGWGRSSGQVNYHIYLPAKARVHVSTANGAVTVDGIDGRVEASSVNGSLKIDNISGEVDASTTNGSIRASYLQARDGRHRFETTNGSVRIYLPSGAGGDVEAETVNGSIDVDFPLTLSSMSRRHIRGSFGNNGGGSYEIETVNGSVKILEN